MAFKYSYSIKFLCEILKVNRRSYYKWIASKISNREKENKIIKEKKYTKSSAEYKAENILNREFTALAPQSKVLTDITEFKYGKDKKIYLCATLDLYDKSILSFSLSDKANIKLVLEVLINSFPSKKRRKTILHSDRGKQFTSLEYKQALEKLGIIHSMSRVGKCIDNGPMEGFFGNIKTEKYYLKKYKNLEELENDLLPVKCSIYGLGNYNLNISKRKNRNICFLVFLFI